jgi:hypothetical protein
MGGQTWRKPLMHVAGVEAFDGDGIAAECGLSVGFVTTGALGVAGDASATTACCRASKPRQQ